jgi:hypothetical protein
MCFCHLLIGVLKSKCFMANLCVLYVKKWMPKQIRVTVKLDQVLKHINHSRFNSKYAY